MKANELRVGNLVWRVFAPFGNERDRWYETIKKLSVDDDLSLPSSYIEPIKLTPELLERCGFVKEGILYHYGKFSIAFGDTIITKDGRTYFNSWAILDHSPKYLHQIQNIYHALTGNELEVKM